MNCTRLGSLTMTRSTATPKTVSKQKRKVTIFHLRLGRSLRTRIRVRLYDNAGTCYYNDLITCHGHLSIADALHEIDGPIINTTFINDVRIH